MGQTEAKHGGPRSELGSTTKNRAANWCIGFTGPYGKRYAGSAFRQKGEGDQQIAAIHTAIQRETDPS